ncbi:MAG TPA: OmpH family outer membrane protein [Granulicella sp.]|jgi:outer membrane protein
MKRSLAVVCSFCLLGFSSGTPAQTSTSGVNAEHLVTVSFNTAVLQTTEAQHEFAALQTRYAPRQAQLQALNDEVESLRKQLSGGDKLADAEKESREKSLDSKEKQLQRQAEDFRNDSQADSQQIYQRIAQKVYAFLQTYSQRNGFSIVIERGSDASPVVWYTAKNMDITDELIKAYNAEGETTPHSNTNKTAPTRNPPQPLPSAPAPH